MGPVELALAFSFTVLELAPVPARFGLLDAPDLLIALPLALVDVPV